jgi:hypothetical protein
MQVAAEVVKEFPFLIKLLRLQSVSQVPALGLCPEEVEPTPHTCFVCLFCFSNTGRPTKNSRVLVIYIYSLLNHRVVTSRRFSAKSV